MNFDSVDRAIEDAKALLKKYEIKEDQKKTRNPFEYEMRVLERFNDETYCEYLKSLSFDEIMLHFKRLGLTCLSSVFIQKIRNLLSISMDEYCLQFREFINHFNDNDFTIKNEEKILKKEK